MSTPRLDVRTFPLHGSRLIEASAGTGKTWTIAMLYVRLVLGPRAADDPNGFARALLPPDILVVTFTEAATQELRTRIRRRLAQAAEVFRAPASPPDAAGDLQALYQLRADYPADDWPRLASRLQLAAEWMDQAAIATIHGWCLRMLREHAFDGNTLFRQTLETDPSELLAEVARDAWRTFYAPLPEALAREVLRWWRGPDDLLRAVRDLLPHTANLPADTPPPQALLQSALDQRQAALAELKAPWPAWVAELRERFEADAKRVNGRKFRPQYYGPWLDRLHAWAIDPDAQEPPALNTGWERLTPTGLAEVYLDPANCPDHPALHALAALPGALAALPNAQSSLLQHAARWVQQRFQQAQARRAQLGFDDVLQRLDHALHGPAGEALAATLRQQFPVALIDEFQDTDPVQYRIFDRVYRVAEPAPETGLVLIGDPKQAIYAFRGADIYTYLQARRACAGRLYTLDTNFRSDAALVAAVNHCFQQAETRAAGQGAFGFRNPAGDNPVPFEPAQAAGPRTRWCPDGPEAPSPVGPLTLWHLPAPEGKPLGRDAALRQMAEACATEMVGLLQRPTAGFATEGSPPHWRALRPSDMAVLVNSRREADAIRAALAQRGVRSVYLSDRESVYRSAVAEDLQHWLQACAQPDDPRALRAALGTAVLALDWATLDRMRHDEDAWDTAVLRFRRYHSTWRQRGVLPMLRELLHDFDVPARLLAADAAAEGERTLTDLLHLAELLQDASTTLDGEHALVRHLAEERRLAALGRSGDAPQIRLESDADRVQVITVHKSKGLEYPLVFYPFATHHRPVEPDQTVLRWHDTEGRAHLTLGGSADERARAAQQADAERLGEDLRKLYVALTRARHATWVGVAPLDDLHRSALGYLVGAGQPIALHDWPAPLAERLAGPSGTVTAAPMPTNDRWEAPAEAPTRGQCRTYRGQPRPRWWIASYSALRLAAPDGDAPPHLAVPDTAQDDLLLEPAPTELDAAAWDAADNLHSADPDAQLDLWSATTSVNGTQSAHTFPKGSAAGTLLHDALQWCAEQGWAPALNNPQRLRDKVAQLCQTHGWDAWAGSATNWLTDLLQAPLPLPAPADHEAHPCLAQLSTCQAEMEFWLAVAPASTQDLDRVVTQHTLGAAARPPLQVDQLHGMLKGFIDLVFEHQGRYYVADYKSNWLGPDDSHYTAARLQQAVLDARYDLQYSLYLLALHRLLRQRLPGYDYDQHMGGAVYLFLRGWRGPAGGVLHERPPRALIDALDRLFETGSAAC